MPVEAVRPDQIVIMVAFLLLLVAMLVMVRRFRGRITTGMRANKRMQYVEDLALGPQQRLHLIEVDGRSFLVHAGKGHAASFMPVDGGAPMMAPNAPSPGAQSRAQEAQQTRSNGKSQATAQAKTSAAKTSAVNTGGGAESAPQKTGESSLIGAAIANARKRNPLLGFGK